MTGLDCSQPVEVLHIITGLGIGGAEMMLAKLLMASDRGRFHHRVVSLTGQGPMASRIKELGIPVVALDLRGGPGAWLGGYRRLRQLIDKDRPDIVQSWMYHADLLAGLVLGRARRETIPLIWGIRQSTFPDRGLLQATRMIASLCAWGSRRWPRRILVCAEAAREVHVAMGYARERMTVIPNGFDTNVFVPDASRREAMRMELGIGPVAPLIGMVARFDPQKDHRTFLRAASEVVTRCPSARFVLCGRGVDQENRELLAWLHETGLEHAMSLLGPREDIHRILTALDCLVSSSAYGEGFPNVVGEAMSTGIPCVVTDVGDSATIVGDTGRVVRPGDPTLLAQAIEDILALPVDERQSLGEKARARIVERYSLPIIARRYEALYEEVMTECAA